jgi:hypothetical protein
MQCNLISRVPPAFRDQEARQDAERIDGGGVLRADARRQSHRPVFGLERG